MEKSLFHFFADQIASGKACCEKSDVNQHHFIVFHFIQTNSFFFLLINLLLEP